MRLLVHGMQSSGATAFTLFLAQRPDCLALVDIPNNFAAPRLRTDIDFVAKAVITTAYPLAVHMERFRPDKIILLLRDPRDNYQSLKTKPYRHYSGLMAEKFLLLDQIFAERDRFDAVIEYERFVARDPAVIDTICRLGWPVTPDFYTYRRRHEEIIGGLFSAFPDLPEHVEFVFGNVRGGMVDDKHRAKPRDPAVDDELERLCPRLLAYYRSLD